MKIQINDGDDVFSREMDVPDTGGVSNWTLADFGYFTIDFNNLPNINLSVVSGDLNIDYLDITQSI